MEAAKSCKDAGPAPCTGQIQSPRLLFRENPWASRSKGFFAWCPGSFHASLRVQSAPTWTRVFLFVLRNSRRTLLFRRFKRLGRTRRIIGGKIESPVRTLEDPRG